MLEIRNTVNEMKNAFLTSSLVEEAQLRKESEFEAISKETFKAEDSKKSDWKK